MPKFTIELDTETKDCAFFINGQNVNLESFSIGKYSYLDCDGNEVICKNCSYTIDGENGGKVTVNYAYDSKGNVVEDDANYSLNKELGKIISLMIATSKINKKLYHNKDKKKNKNKW